MVNQKAQNAVLGCNLINDRMISVRFQGKPFNIMVIQVYALTSNTEEAEVEWFPWKRKEIILLFLRLHASTAFRTLLLTRMDTPFPLRDSCPQ